jgi:hypothetical protein
MKSNFSRDDSNTSSHTADPRNSFRPLQCDEAEGIRAAVHKQRSVGPTSGPAGAAAVTRTPAGTSREGTSHAEPRRVSAPLVLGIAMMVCGIALVLLAAAGICYMLEYISPLVMGASAIMIIRKMSWRWHPALWCFLVTQTWLEALTSARWMVRDYSILIQVLALGALLAEMARIKRANLPRNAQASIAGALLVACVFHVGAHHWTVDYQLSLFRCDVRLAAAAMAWAIMLYRWIYPALESHGESRRHRVYGVGVTAWLTVSAVSGSFVRGGIGFSLLPYTPQRWQLIGLLSYAALMTTVTAMAVALNWGSSGRKRAAKTPKGLTKTGLIESERAA